MIWGGLPTFLLKESDEIPSANYVVIESVYGDRRHENTSLRRDKLEDVIEDTIRAGGALLIPAFSIERTQEILYEIESMMEGGRIPPTPVYLDSPLAINITGIYKKYETDYLRDDLATTLTVKDGLFNFRNLHKTLTTDQSKTIAQTTGSKIIIAGSGMSNGGRILHHERRYLSDPKNTLLLIGHQSVGSLGRLLQDGASSVTIFGETVLVRARVVTVSGYSAHRDSLGLLDFVKRSGDQVAEVFVTMGEPRASLYLVQKIRDYLGVKATAPSNGAVANLPLLVSH